MFTYFVEIYFLMSDCLSFFTRILWTVLALLRRFQCPIVSPQPWIINQIREWLHCGTCKLAPGATIHKWCMASRGANHKITMGATLDLIKIKLAHRKELTLDCPKAPNLMIWKLEIHLNVFSDTRYNFQAYQPYTLLIPDNRKDIACFPK